MGAVKQPYMAWRGVARRGVARPLPLPRRRRPRRLLAGQPGKGDAPCRRCPWLSTGMPPCLSEPSNKGFMAADVSISFGSPHVRCTPMGRTCGEPGEIKKNTHPKNITAPKHDDVPALHVCAGVHFPALPGLSAKPIPMLHLTQGVAGLESWSVVPAAHWRSAHFLLESPGTNVPASHLTQSVFGFWSAAAARHSCELSKFKSQNQHVAAAT